MLDKTKTQIQIQSVLEDLPESDDPTMWLSGLELERHLIRITQYPPQPNDDYVW